MQEWNRQAYVLKAISNSCSHTLRKFTSRIQKQISILFHIDVDCSVNRREAYCSIAASCMIKDRCSYGINAKSVFLIGL